MGNEKNNDPIFDILDRVSRVLTGLHKAVRA